MESFSGLLSEHRQTEGVCDVVDVGEVVLEDLFCRVLRVTRTVNLTLISEHGQHGDISISSATPCEGLFSGNEENQPSVFNPNGFVIRKFPKLCSVL
jgi:hypothetical protein